MGWLHPTQTPELRRREDFRHAGDSGERGWKEMDACQVSAVGGGVCTSLALLPSGMGRKLAP